MPLIRKLVDIGSARGVTLPKSWIDNLEKTNGKLLEVAMDINGSITISPHKFKEKGRK
jgi:antitoxin component of MazEF toxin-antitoxin module